MKLSEEAEPKLEVVAKEARLDVREPRLLLDEQERVLSDRLGGRWIIITTFSFSFVFSTFPQINRRRHLKGTFLLACVVLRSNP